MDEHAEAMVAEEAKAASTVAEEPQFAATKEAQRRSPWCVEDPRPTRTRTGRTWTTFCGRPSPQPQPPASGQLRVPTNYKSKITNFFF